MKSSSKRIPSVSPCEALVADIPALLVGHAAPQRFGDVHQFPLPDPDCRPQTITFAGTDEPLQLRGHFPIHVNAECLLPCTHARCVMTPYKRTDVRLVTIDIIKTRRVIGCLCLCLYIYACNIVTVDSNVPLKPARNVYVTQHAPEFNMWGFYFFSLLLKNAFSKARTNILEKCFPFVSQRNNFFCIKLKVLG